MIPQFKKAVMEADDPKIEEPLAENMLQQVKIVFGSLEESEK
jgi:hypothetical protein